MRIKDIAIASIALCAAYPSPVSPQSSRVAQDKSPAAIIAESFGYNPNAGHATPVPAISYIIDPRQPGAQRPVDCDAQIMEDLQSLIDRLSREQPVVDSTRAVIDAFAAAWKEIGKPEPTKLTGQNAEIIRRYADKVVMPRIYKECTAPVYAALMSLVPQSPRISRTSSADNGQKETRPITGFKADMPVPGN